MVNLQQILNEATPQQRMVAQQTYARRNTPVKKPSSGLLGTVLPIVGGIGGGILGSFAAPGIGTAAGGAAGSMAGRGLADMLTGHQSSAGDYAMEGALGTLGGVGKAFKAGRAAIGAAKAGEGGKAATAALLKGSRAEQVAKVDPTRITFDGATEATPVPVYRSVPVTGQAPTDLRQGLSEIMGRVNKKPVEPSVVAARRDLVSGNHINLRDLKAKARTTYPETPPIDLRNPANAPVVGNTRVANQPPIVGDSAPLMGNLSAPAVEQAAPQVARQGVRGNLADIGQNLRTGVVNPSVTASPYGATAENDMVHTLQSLGLKGSSAAQYKKLPKVMNDLNGQLTEALKLNTNKGSRQTLMGEIGRTANDSPYFVNADPLHEKNLIMQTESFLKDIPENFTAADVSNAKSNLAKKMTGVFSKVGAGKDLNAKEAAQYSIWKSLDKTITELAPEAKDVTMKMSALHEAAPGLLKGSRKTVGIPLLGIQSRSAERGIQAGRDMAGRVMMKASGPLDAAATASPSMLKRTAGIAVPQIAGHALTGFGQGTDLPEPSQDMEAPGPIDAPEGADTSYPQESFLSDVQADIAQTGGKNIATLEKVYKLVNDTKAKKPLSAAANTQSANAQSGMDAIQQMASEISGNENLPTTDAAAGVLGNFGRGLAGTQGYNAARQEIIDVLARLRTGAAISATEEKRFKNALPSAFDSPDVIAEKLSRYQTLFGRILANQQGGSPDLEMLAQ